MYAAANMAKDALVKKAEAGLFGVRHESGTKGGQKLLASAAAAVQSFREVPPKQIVLVAHYFVREGGRVVSAVRETEAAAEKLRRFFAGEGSMLVAQERVGELAAAIAKKGEQLQLFEGKVADAEREERNALGAGAAAGAELAQLLQSAEWKAWEAECGEWEQRKARQERLKAEWVGLLGSVEREARKAEHAGTFAAADAAAFRGWLAGGKPEGHREVLERLASVAESPERVAAVARAEAPVSEWSEPAPPEGPEKDGLERKVAAAAALAERAGAERERLAADRGKLAGELHDRVVDLENAILKGTGRSVSVQKAGASVFG